MTRSNVAQQLEHAFQLLNQGHREPAEQIGRSVLAQFPNHPDALSLVGQIELGRRQFGKARRLFCRGLKSAPAHPSLLNNAGWAEKELKNYEKAEAYFLRALKVEPGFFYAKVNLAILHQDLRKFASAKRLYREVIQQNPDQLNALANLANILEREHELDEAASLARRALAIDPQHYVARLTLADIAARSNTFDQVIQLLAPVLRSSRMAPMDRAVAGAKCAHAFDKLGDYKSAFSLYRGANQMLHRLYEPAMRNPDRMYSPAAFRCIEHAIPEFSFSRDRVDTELPVFLIGFPRSGTTLLDQILSSHSQVTVLEEKPTLTAAFNRYPATEAGLKALQQAGEDRLQKLRRSYWANVDRELRGSQRTPVIVDKLPLNAFALLHINKLFPGAKIIVAVRDPRDCVFSGFQHMFEINPATYQLLRLDTAASFYEQVMNVIVRVREAAVFPMKFVKYEQIIERYAEEVRALMHFLALDWEDSLLRYQETAKVRDVRTPSASQVIQPLYTSSIGKWKHYREWIETSFDPLDKWVEAWGYPR